MKRRNRHAVFSGDTSKYATRIDRGRQDENGKNIQVLVGPVSLSKAVINTGRGPDKERMQEYYQRVHSYDEPLPKTLGFTEPMRELMGKYKEIVRDTPREMRISLVNNHTGMLDLYFSGVQFFFVDVDYKLKRIRRSRIYNSKKYALLMLSAKKVTWVESVNSPH